MQATSSYLVLSTPRSGSTLLCRALESTDLAGYPKEYFSPEGKRWSRESATTAPSAYVASLLAKQATPNGVFGAKISWRQLLLFEQACRREPRYRETPLPDILSDLFPSLRYLRITRRDKVRQAISYWKALQTGVWGKAAAADGSGSASAAFDYDALSDLVRLLQEHEAGIDGFVSRSNLSPFTIVYEDLVDSYRETVTAALAHLGIDVPSGLVLPEPRTARLADDETEAWVGEYARIARERARSADPSGVGV